MIPWMSGRALFASDSIFSFKPLEPTPFFWVDHSELLPRPLEVGIGVGLIGNARMKPVKAEQKFILYLLQRRQGWPQGILRHFANRKILGCAPEILVPPFHRGGAHLGIG